jgi:hypothetical protein
MKSPCTQFFAEKGRKTLENGLPVEANFQLRPEDDQEGNGR